MKTQILVLTLLLTGCATDEPYSSRPPERPTDPQNIRHDARFKAYPLGRYVDPADPSIMHEGHVVYVQEAASKWNLSGSQPTAVPLGPAQTVPSPASTPNPSAIELLVHLNERRKVDQVITNQTAEVQRLVDSVSSMMPLLQRFATQATQIEIRQRAIEERLHMLESKTTTAPAAALRWTPNTNSPATGIRREVQRFLTPETNR